MISVTFITDIIFLALGIIVGNAGKIGRLITLGWIASFKKKRASR